MIIKQDRAQKAKGIYGHSLPSLPNEASEDEFPEEVHDPIERLTEELNAAQVQINKLRIRIETEREARFREGYDTGQEAGYKKGLETIRDKAKRFDAVVTAMDAQRAEMLRHSEQFVVDFSLKMLEKIVGETGFLRLSLDRDRLKAFVGAAMEEFAGATRYIVRVHEDDHKLLKEFEGELLEYIDEKINFIFETDSSLRPGECLIEADTGVLEVTLENQLDVLKKAFGQ